MRIYLDSCIKVNRQTSEQDNLHCAREENC